MVDYFSYFPNEDLFFIDTCGFCLNYQEPICNDKIRRNNNKSVGYLLEETSRLCLLTNKLSEMDNWLITTEIIQEFKEGIIMFKEKLKKRYYPPLISALKK